MQILSKPPTVDYKMRRHQKRYREGRSGMAKGTMRVTIIARKSQAGRR